MKLGMNVLFVMMFLAFCAGHATAKEYHVYYLGGQSNMDGFGYVKDIPAELNQPVKGVMIFHGNMALDMTPVDGKGIWAELRPGHGTEFTSDGKTNTYSERFGLELTFGKRLKELYPNRNIALIKYSRAGSSIDLEAAREWGSWEPDFEGGEGSGKGINQYDHFLACVRNAMAVQDIDGDGENDTLIPSGIAWMQGESDAFPSKKIALRYEANLKRLMTLIRAALRYDDIPVVIGRITDSGKDTDGKIWDYGDIVRAAQASFAKKDGYAALVTSTDNYGYSDPWHYDSKGYIDLGKQFADAMAGIQ